VIDRAKKIVGLNPEIQPSHGLRKFFESQLDRTGMDVDKKRQLEGHSSGVRNAYTSRDIDELRKLYESAYQFLDLREQAVVPQKMKEIMDENEALREKNQKLEARLVELTKKMDITAGGLEELLEWKRESERIDKKKD
jgi:hypothetical protein